MYKLRLNQICLLYTLILTGGTDWSNYDKYEHTSNPPLLSSYRDCFGIPEKYANYENRYSEDIDNYIYYCIRMHDYKGVSTKRGCHGTWTSFETLYEKSMYIYIFKMHYRQADSLSYRRLLVFF